MTPIAPLPNLDGHVLQGDALLDPVMLAASLGGRAFREAPPRFAGSPSRAASTPPRGGKSVRRRRSYAAQKPHSADAPDDWPCGARIGIAELLSAARNRDLFGRTRGLNLESGCGWRACAEPARAAGGATQAAQEGGRLPSFRSSPLRGCDAAGWVRPGNGKSAVGARGALIAPRREPLATRYACWHSRRLVASRISPISRGVTERGSSWRDRAASSRCSFRRSSQPAATLSPCASGCHNTRIERASPLPERVAHTFGAAVYQWCCGRAADPSGTELNEHWPWGQIDVARGSAAAAPERWSLDSHTRRGSHQPSLRAEFPTVGDRWSPQLG